MTRKRPESNQARFGFDPPHQRVESEAFRILPAAMELVITRFDSGLFRVIRVRGW
jgi:hypothetical protein